ncbi:MAG: putative serine esterase [Chitinophagales bacterium]|nr:MAG: putative serine esterase [Chitinophagales bacterium]
MKKCYLLALLIVFPVLLTIAQSAQRQNKKYIPSDTANTYAGPLPYDYKSQMKYKKIKTTSHYLIMRDSVKIAINLSLPRNLEEGEKIPTILYQTRYWRGAKFRWPFSMFVNNFSTKTGRMIRDAIRCGYAFVAVDVRGSGASTGSRKHPWTADEVQDGAQIVDWIIAQPWSNGRVGATGISYSGTTSEFLATTQHPAVKAVMPMFSLFDVYDDIAMPGGLQLEYFTKNWGFANQKLDNNKLPRRGSIRLLVKGVQPVKGQKKVLKREALPDHQANLNVHDGVRSLTFRDDVSEVDGQTGPDVFSPHSYAKKIDDAGIAVYSVSGYYDGAYGHAAIKRFLTLQNPQNRLLLGPWEHGGNFNCSPFNPGASGFDKTAEVLKFFDYYLKGKDTGIDKEPRVHYFTVGEERWKASSTWPPENVSYRHFYLQADNKLYDVQPDAVAGAYSHTPSAYPAGFTVFKTDTTFGTGTKSRWRSLIGQLHTPRVYEDWHERSQQLTYFDSEPLQHEMEVTGQPIVSFYISCSVPDAGLFVYLQDVDENGKTTYVTEGQFRLLHRKVSEEQPPYKDDPHLPYHSFLRKDGSPMVPGKVEEVSFELLPVSYLFKKGHRIRISLSGADRDHFTPVGPDAEWRVQHNASWPSMIALPVVPR